MISMHLTAQCTYVIDMQDSFGDGWNGCALNVDVNGAFFGTYTLASGSTGQQTFSVNNLDVVEFTYSIGSFNTEVSYQISVNGSQLFADGTPVATQPTAGLVFTNQCGGCDPPGNLSANNISTTTADLGWTSTTGTNFILEYGPSGFSPGSGTLVATTSNPFSATGLPSGTTIDFYIQQICTSSGDTSIQSSPFSFTTLCASFPAPWSEDFSSSSTPNCWSESGSESWRYSTTAAYAAANAGDHSGNGSNYAWIDGSSPNGPSQISTLTSPNIDIAPLGSPLLSYWVYSHNGNGVGNNTLEVELYDGASWNLINTINTDLTDNWINFIYNINNLTITGPIRIRFTISENSPGTSFYNDILIDDIEVKDAPNIALDAIDGLQASYCNAPIAVDLIISNKSINPESDVPWFVESNGVVINSGSIAYLGPNSTDTVAVTIGIYPSNANADIVAYTALLSDLTLSDDTISSSVQVSYTSLNATMTNAVGCLGDSAGVILSEGAGGLGQYTYLWSANAGALTVNEASGLVAGVYSISITDSIGCTASASLNLLDPPSILTVIDSISDAGCNGAASGSIVTTTSGGVPGYSYAWSNGANGSSINNLTSGNYDLTVTDAYGCMLSYNYSVNQPASALAVNLTDNGNGSVTAAASGGQAGYSYLWNSLAGSQTSATATGLSSGTYTVLVTDANGCTEFATIDIIVVGTTTLATIQNIDLFPNPSFGNAYLSFKNIDAPAASISISDLSGKVLFEQHYTLTNTSTISLPTSRLQAGLYLINIRYKQQHITKKLLRFD